MENVPREITPAPFLTGSMNIDEDGTTPNVAETVLIKTRTVL
jgi:hypothetical protein